ncbi:VOC family protein, partial [Halieaceae bacterium]|nr:VOC family protein [Halieaceae bacterium]
GGAPTAQDNNLDHFCLLIDALPEDDLRRHLAAHDVDAGEFASRYGAQGWGQSVYIKDPDGNTVELRNRLDP